MFFLLYCLRLSLATNLVESCRGEKMEGEKKRGMRRVEKREGGKDERGEKRGEGGEG